MNLQTYIQSVGIKAFCQQVEVPYHTAYEWMRGTRTPRRRSISRICATTPVTYAGIFNAEPATAIHDSTGIDDSDGGQGSQRHEQKIERPRNTLTG